MPSEMRKHHKNIYYSAGLISILLLPVLCGIFLKSRDAFTSYGVIPIQVWDGKDYKNEVTHFLHSKKFTTVNLTGNCDAIKLKKASKKIRIITLFKDSVNGVRFHFEKKSEYWSYIKVLDILQIEKAKLYVIYKNDIWFANPKEPKPNKNLKQIKLYHCSYSQNIIETGEVTSVTIWQKISEIIKVYYLPIIAYLLMLFFSIRKLIRFN
jgi:hypothetical protein